MPIVYLRIRLTLYLFVKMTTAHRPTFDPARGKSSQAQGSIRHARALPSHETIKYRQEGQGGDADKKRELERELFEKEQEHLKKVKRIEGDRNNGQEDFRKYREQVNNAQNVEKELSVEEIEERRRKILQEIESNSEEENRSEQNSDNSDESDESESDEEELLRELEKIKRERAEEKRKQEEKERLQQQEAREREIAYGNPLLNPKREDFAVKKSWMDETVFRNQGGKSKDDKGFINDLLRSDFHKKFMDKYVR